MRQAQVSCVLIKFQVEINLKVIYLIRRVSEIPSLPFNIKDVDTFYFSVQKCFGLPSGLGIWVYNNRCLDRHNELRKSKKTGTYHSLHRANEMSLKCQTPETPNVLAIYLLSKVTEDMIKIELIISEEIQHTNLHFTIQ